MGLNLGAFWEGAAPGVNAAVEDARRHQQERMQAEHDIITGYADPSKYHPSVVAAAQQQLLEMAQDHVNGKYKAGKYVKGLAPLLNPSAAPGAAMTGPPAADAGGADASASGAAQAYSGTLPGKPGAEMSQGSAALPDKSPTEAPAAGGPPAAGAAAPQPAPTPAPAPPQAAQAAPAAPGGPPPAAAAPAPGPLSQALRGTPVDQALAGNAYWASLKEKLDAVHAAMPSHDDRRKQAAAMHGYSPEQLENPNFEFTDANGNPAIQRDPAKAAARTGYQTHLQRMEDQGGTEERALAGQLYTTERAEVTAEGTDRRQAERQKFQEEQAGRSADRREAGYDARADRRQRAAEERTAAASKDKEAHENKRALRVALAHADADYRKRMADVAHLKPEDKFYQQTKTAAEAAKQDAIEEARAQYSEFASGKELGAPPAEGKPGTPAVAGPAPTPTPTASAAHNPSNGPPPSPDMLKRATTLATRARALGGSRKLSPDEQRELHQLLRQGVRPTLGG